MLPNHPGLRKDERATDCRPGHTTEAKLDLRSYGRDSAVQKTKQTDGKDRPREIQELVGGPLGILGFSVS